MRLIEYEYAWQNQPRKGQKLDCRSVAADGVYCQGVIKALPRSGLRSGGVDPAVELKDMQDKFKDGTVCRISDFNPKKTCDVPIEVPAHLRTLQRSWEPVV